MTPWVLAQAPRTWQLHALDEWVKQLRGVLSVVTGGGKTYFAFMCMIEFIKRFPQGRVFIVVPTVALLDQWYVALQTDLGLSPAEIGVYSGEEKSSSHQQVNLFVINTARQLASSLLGGRVGFLIVDECHRAGSTANSHALLGKYGAALGLSATPIREYDNAFEEVVSPILGPIIFEYGYEEALRDGVISPFELINVRVDLLPDEAERYASLTKRIARESDRVNRLGADDIKLKRLLQLRGAVSSTAAMRVPIAAKLADLNRGRRTLIFHERVSAADAIANILSQRDHNVGIYHTGIGPWIRRDNLRLYRQGVFDVLLTCRALDEGLNVPETSTAIIASATASNRQRIQRLGRVLRPAPGKAFSTIYSVYATDVEERRLLREASSLTEVASVTWQHGTKSDNGKDSQ